MTRPAFMTAPGTVQILDLLTEGDGRAPLFAGGAVRDWLQGQPPATITDIDMVTPLLPGEVLARLEAAGLKPLPTGRRYGVATLCTGGLRYGIATMRRDETCHGRQADIAFTRDLTEDARRRDFTFNAIYADREGNIIDPAGGLEDALAGRLRFVGDPDQRLAEDRLRALRFFRFLARPAVHVHDPAALGACFRAAPQLGRLSGERVRDELFRILAAPDPVPVLAMMARGGILAGAAGLTADCGRLARFAGACSESSPLHRLGALSLSPPRELAARLRLSRTQARLLHTMATAAGPGGPAGLRPLLYQCRLHHPGIADRTAIALMVPGIDPATARAAARDPDPVFPLSGRDLLAAGMPPGPGIGRLLGTLERLWIRNGFRPDRAGLLREALAREDPEHAPLPDRNGPGNTPS